MPDLFQEALLDAKRLREAAELEAKTSIIEALAPQIRKLLREEMGGGPAASDTLDDTSGFLFPKDPPGPSESDPAMGVPSPTGDVGSGALPVAVQGTADGLGMAMPDADGRLVVDFDALFVPVAAGDLGSPGSVTMPGTVGSASAVNTGDLGQTPVGDVAFPAPSAAAAPPPAGVTSSPPPPTALPAAPTAPGAPGTTPETEQAIEATPMAALESWHRDLLTIKETVDQVVERGVVPTSIAAESLRGRMFRSYDQLRVLAKNNSVFDQKILRLNESRLDFLFQVLKSAENGSIYGGAEKDREKMVSLADIQKQLFSEGVSGFDKPVSHTLEPGDSVSTGDTGIKTDPEKTEHAKKVSGVAPGVDIQEEALDRALQEMADAFVKEQSGGSAESTTPGANPSLVAAGDPFDKKVSHRIEDLPENTVLEIDETELKEAIRQIRKENLKAQLRAIREAAMEELKTSAPEKNWEDQQVPEGGLDPSHANLKEDGMEALAVGGPDEDPMGSSDGAMDDMGGGDEDMGEGSSLADLAGGGDVGGPAVGMDMPLDLALTLNIDNVDTLEIVTDEETLNQVAGSVGGAETEEGDDSLEILDDTDDDAGSGDTSDVGSGAPPFAADDDDPTTEEPGDEKTMTSESKTPRTTATTAKPTTPKKATPPTKARETAEAATLRKQLAEQALFTNKVVFLNKFLQEQGLSKKQHVKIAGLLDKAKTLVELKETYTRIKTVLKENANRTTTAQQKVAETSASTGTGGAASSPSVVTESVSSQNSLRESAAPALSPELASMSLNFERAMRALNLKSPKGE